jgi:Tfp pilus assembly protein PilF
MTMKTLIRALAAAVLLAPTVLLASGGGGGGGMSSAAPADPTLERANQAIARSDWGSAQSTLKDAVARDPRNADYRNLYAYSLRKGPNPDMSLVFEQYNEALRIDPKHKGANEYLGEAYLMVGNVPKAKEQLATLDKICFFPCQEFSDLKKHIAEYEAKRQ